MHYRMKSNINLVKESIKYFYKEGLDSVIECINTFLILTQTLLILFIKTINYLKTIKS